MGTPIFSHEQILVYAENRLHGKNTPHHRYNYVLHNGRLPSEAHEVVIEPYHDGLPEGLSRVIQDCGREPLFLDGDTIHYPQYSGNGRRNRIEDMISLFLEVTGRDSRYQSLERDGNAWLTDIYYENFAYDFMKGLILPTDKDDWTQEPEAVFEDLDGRDVDHLIFGPLDAIGAQAGVEVLARGASEYLDAQLLKIGDQKVLNVGYVYEDQAGILVDKFARAYSALAREAGRKKEMGFWYFGRGAGLNNMERGDLFTPSAILDEFDKNMHGLHNRLKAFFHGASFNPATTVLRETVEQLTWAQDRGCIGMEKEAREFTDAIHRANRRHHKSLNITYGIVLHNSDNPLRVLSNGLRDTLAEELEDDRGEMGCARLIVERIGNG